MQYRKLFMKTISVPISDNIEEAAQDFIKAGFFKSEADLFVFKHNFCILSIGFEVFLKFPYLSSPELLKIVY